MTLYCMWIYIYIYIYIYTHTRKILYKTWSNDHKGKKRTVIESHWLWLNDSNTHTHYIYIYIYINTHTHNFYLQKPLKNQGLNIKPYIFHPFDCSNHWAITTCLPCGRQNKVWETNVYNFHFCTQMWNYKLYKQNSYQ